MEVSANCNQHLNRDTGFQPVRAVFNHTKTLRYPPSTLLGVLRVSVV